MGSILHKIEQPFPTKLHGSGVILPSGQEMGADLWREVRRNRLVTKIPGSLMQLCAKLRKPGCQIFRAHGAVEKGVEGLYGLLPEGPPLKDMLLDGKRESYKLFLRCGETIGTEPIGLRYPLTLSAEDHRKTVLQLQGEVVLDPFGGSLRLGRGEDPIPHPKPPSICRGSVEYRCYRKSPLKIRIPQGDPNPNMRHILSLCGMTGRERPPSRKHQQKKCAKRVTYAMCVKGWTKGTRGTKKVAEGHHGTTPIQAYPQEMAVPARRAVSQSLHMRAFWLASRTKV
jgi:hypothetical protein